MQENFRQFLDRLRQAGELVDLHQPVDIRHIATLVDQAKTALFFHKVIGYDVPVVSGIIRSTKNLPVTSLALRRSASPSAPALSFACAASTMRHHM